MMIDYKFATKLLQFSSKGKKKNWPQGVVFYIEIFLSFYPENVWWALAHRFSENRNLHNFSKM